MRTPSVTVDFGTVPWYVWMPVAVVKGCALGWLFWYTVTLIAKQACS